MILSQFDIDRFWSNVDIFGSDECWPWLGNRNQDGYGRFWLNEKLEGAHRISWMLVNGVIPVLFDGRSSMICHSCDNPPCCNPSHLFIGNNKINQKDSAVKDQGDRGEFLRCKGQNHPAASKTEVEIKEIKRYLRKGVLTQKEIAKMYGLAQPTIAAINTGKTWSHVK